MTVFIHQGDAPLSVRQAANRGIRVMHREMTAAGARAGDVDILMTVPHADLPQRLLDILAALPGQPATYADYAAAWEADNATNAANNLFNHQVASYQSALARLAQYRLADGRPAIYEDQPTGEVDEQGQPVTESVMVQSPIDPLPAQVEQPVYDADGTQTGTEMVPNPLIVQDDAERAAAQATVDALAAIVGA